MRSIFSIILLALRYLLGGFTMSSSMKSFVQELRDSGREYLASVVEDARSPRGEQEELVETVESLTEYTRTSVRDELEWDELTEKVREADEKFKFLNWHNEVHNTRRQIDVMMLTMLGRAHELGIQLPDLHDVEADRVLCGDLHEYYGWIRRNYDEGPDIEPPEDIQNLYISFLSN